MEDYATKQDLQVLRRDIHDLEQCMSYRFEHLEAKIDQAVEDLSEIIRSFMTQVDVRFRRLEESRRS